MLELKDIFYLPKVEPLIERLIAERRGLVVIAGLDPRVLTHVGTRDTVLPSGRSAIHGILMRQIMMRHPEIQAIVVARSRDAVRIPRSLRRRAKLQAVQPTETYSGAIARAANRRPDLLVVDQLTPETAPTALEATGNGLWVLSQLDTVFRGVDAVRHVLDLGESPDLLAGPIWVVAVQRLPTLCSRCRTTVQPDPSQLPELLHRYPHLADTLEETTFFRAEGCPHCQFTGRQGEVTVFDLFRSGLDALTSLDQVSLMSLESYLLELASQGYLSLDDVLHFETDQLRRTYRLLATSELALAGAKSELERRLAELEAANKVLQKRTEALISLESIGRALITSTSLGELAAQLCRHARDLCSADRAIVYLLSSDETTAEVLAVIGWDSALVYQPLEAALIIGDDTSAEPHPFDRWPPGVPHRPTDVTASALRAGLWVPLVAQAKRVGLMIVHTSQKLRFAPGEVALLQTFADQAAVAIQRAELIEALRRKLAQLQAAQEELVQKERLERELELARQVQQGVLPHVFPLLPGYTFAAHNEPARQVGGDFYDVICLDTHCFGLVIGDVSDKGMPAALYMALTRSLLLAEARRDRSPRAVLNNVHRLLQELGRPGLFVTVFYGTVESQTRRLIYARAGHDRPLLLRKGRVEPLGGEGTFLGFPDLEDLHLTEERLDLCAGDRLVLYTDGLADALAPDGELFGLDRLVSTLQSCDTLPPAEVCRVTFEALTTFQEDVQQYDDMTMLVMAVE